MGGLEQKTAGTDVAVIIVTYNSSGMIESCISSIREQTTGFPYQIYVVDNGSQDDTVERIRRTFPDVVLIRNRRNIGFGAANNAGIRASRSRLLMLLNSDTLLLNNAIGVMREFCERHGEKTLGVVGAALLDRERRPTHSFGSFPSVSNVLSAGVGRVLRQYHYRDDERRGTVAELSGPLAVDYVTGAAIMIPRSALDRVGLFDERFFMYYEEAELQHRMKSQGLARLLIPGPRILHLTSEVETSARRVLVNVSALRYYRKVLGRAGHTVLKGFFLLFYGLSTVLDLVARTDTLRDNLIHLRKLVRERY